MKKPKSFRETEILLQNGRPKDSIRTFVFKRFAQESYPKYYLPMEHFSLEDEVIAKWNRKGYLVKDVKREERIVITCSLARANIPFEDRKKFQANIK
jgi:hypothetical protein